MTLYPEYTGTMLSVTFKRKTVPKTAAATYALAKRLYEKRGQTLLRQTPFEDKDVLAVTRATANRYGLRTVADLKKVPDLTITAFPEWDTPLAGAARAPLRRPGVRLHPDRGPLGLPAARPR